VGGDGAGGFDGVATRCVASAARFMRFVFCLIRANLLGVVLKHLILEDLVKLTDNLNILNSKHVYVN
jgi:hypothetical protein